MTTDRPELSRDHDHMMEMIAKRIPFRTAPRSGLNDVLFEDGVFRAYDAPTFTGHTVADLDNMFYVQTGLLVDEWYDLFVRAYRLNLIDYVIYSYDTVIAWHCKGNDDITTVSGEDLGLKNDPWWVITDTPISATSTKHQIQVILALRAGGEL